MKWTASLFFLVALLGCDTFGLSQEKRQNLTQAYAGMLAEGKITQAQYDALISGLNGGNDWIMHLIDIWAAIGGSLLGVKVWRGGINERKGTIEVSTT